MSFRGFGGVSKGGSVVFCRIDFRESNFPLFDIVKIGRFQTVIQSFRRLTISFDFWENIFDELNRTITVFNPNDDK